MWGSVNAVGALLDSRADPNCRNKLRGSTPLHAAAMGQGPVDKRLVCVQHLIKARGDPNVPDLIGELPMHACDDEDLRLALGAAPLLLHRAVEERSLSALRTGIQQHGCHIDDTNTQGETALHRAVAVCWFEGLKLLLSSKANVGIFDHLRQTPLHKAVLRGDHRSAKHILLAKADPGVKDCDVEQDPPLSSTPHGKTLDDHWTPLHYAARLCNLVAVRFLLEATADPDATDRKLQTPLHLCLGLRGSASELELGRGIRIRGLARKTEWNGQLGVIIGGAIPSAEGNGQRWPVLRDQAEDAGVLLKPENLEVLADETLDLLLEARADVNLGSHITGVERTVLHMAAHEGDVALADRVLRTGRAFVNKQDKSGLTPLHVAVRGRHWNIVECLIRGRASINTYTFSGKKAVDFARVNGADAAIVDLLTAGTSSTASAHGAALVADPAPVASAAEKTALAATSDVWGPSTTAEVRLAPTPAATTVPKRPTIAYPAKAPPPLPPLPAKLPEDPRSLTF